MAYRLIKIALCLILIISSIFTYVSRANTATLAELAISAKNVRTDALLGYNEFPSNNFSALPQWLRILDFFNKKELSFKQCLYNSFNCVNDNDRVIADFINQNHNLPLIDKIRATNIFFNKWEYKTDRDNYFLSEYWATPDEFMEKSGDCEDYAIIKFFVLRHMGIEPSQMRIVTVFDTIRSIGHAVLAIYLDDEKIIILDSLSDGLFEHTLYKHYIPQYSLNETTRWLHTAPLEIKPRKSYTEPKTLFIINRIESYEYNDRQY